MKELIKLKLSFFGTMTALKFAEVKEGYTTVDQYKEWTEKQIEKAADEILEITQAK